MNRFKALMVGVLTFLTLADSVRADWGSVHYGGYQPWWNIFAKRNRCLNPEEERLQRFWHDYYDAMQRYYRSLDRIDWVAYYKNHGYQINGGCGGYGQQGCGPQRTQFAPVVVSPSMQWAVPNASVGSPAVGPSSGYPSMGMGMGMGMGMPMGGGMPMGNAMGMGMPMGGMGMMQTGYGR